MPDGFAYEGVERPASHVRFLTDLTWVDEFGDRHFEQEIFDEVFRLVNSAERFVLLDMFLYNNFQGKVPERHRQLSTELTEVLISRKEQYPDLQIIVITDPINTVYGGMVSNHLDALRAAGIQVIETDLDALPDSNPCYSLPWRLLVRPFGNAEGGFMPNPFGQGRISVRSWLKLLNFKANHRKVLVADDGDRLTGLVTSANPHDGSSAHRNDALVFSGQAARDLLESEFAIFDMAQLERPELNQNDVEQEGEGEGEGELEGEREEPYRVQVLTEGRIKEAALRLIDGSASGDEIDLAMFYLSERRIIDALKAAQQRGVVMRVVLDPNKDAFGWKKNGIPNRPVAKDLVRAGVPVRWCDTHGEQCHNKTLMVRKSGGEVHLMAGSANFTRRNLNDLNLETDVLIRTTLGTEVATSALRHFNRVWLNEEGRAFTVDYKRYADSSLFKSFLYHVQERTGMSTF
ncbi:MAG: phospholipase [Gammaproteobacteria bacterium]|nr:phospholipase [Gammaproteobacteria bacterium]MBT4494294.1 phospholipase [Gammaproteobacteria bacterium]MBT7370609.1 phospholipase [Gammaproteobacteria bacterium]